MSKGKALIFSAPSGAGKTTIVRHLIKTNPNIGFSISASTRDKRGRTEEHGKDYYFLTPDEFRNKINNEEFIEWEEVYPGNFYGTLKSEIQRIWDSGKTVIFDVDVKGGLKLKEYFGENALAVFVRIPSLSILEQRLRERATDSEDSISRRLFKAEFEMGFADKFDVILVNEELEDTLEKAEQMVSEFMNK